MVMPLWWKNTEDEAVRSWVNDVIRNDAMAVVRIAAAFTGVRTGIYLGDSVPEQDHTALTGQLRYVTDLQVFRERAELVLGDADLEADGKNLSFQHSDQGRLGVVHRFRVTPKLHKS